MTYLNDVEAGLSGTLCSSDVVLLKVTNLCDTHGKATCTTVAHELRDTTRAEAGSISRVPYTEKRKLDTCESAVLVDAVTQEGQVTHIVVIADAGSEPGCVVPLNVNLAVLSVNGSPPAFGAHRAEMGLGTWVVDAEAGAVGCDIEPIAHRLRTDPNRLEQGGIRRSGRDSEMIIIRAKDLRRIDHARAE